MWLWLIPVITVVLLAIWVPSDPGPAITRRDIRRWKRGLH